MAAHDFHHELHRHIYLLQQGVQGGGFFPQHQQHQSHADRHENDLQGVALQEGGDDIGGDDPQDHAVNLGGGVFAHGRRSALRPEHPHKTGRRASQDCQQLEQRTERV